METTPTSEVAAKSNLTNFKDLFRNTSRIFKILFQNMPWLFSAMILLTIVIGVIPVFSAKVLGDLIDKIIESTKVGDVKIVYPTLILFAVLTAVPTVIRNILSFCDRHL